MAEAQSSPAPWPGAQALLLNLVPVGGVVVLGWDAMLLLLFYWIETLVIGVVNVLKIGAIGLAAGRIGTLVCAGVILFFCLHYGIFCSGHGAFLMMLMTFSGGAIPTDNTSFADFDPFMMAWGVISSDAGLWWSVAAIVVMQVGVFVVFWLWPGTWRRVNPYRQMIEPYGRIVVMHLTIMIAAIPVLLLGAPALAVLALAVMKTGLDLRRPLFTFEGERAEKVWAVADRYWPPPSLSDK